MQEKIKTDKVVIPAKTTPRAVAEYISSAPQTPTDITTEMWKKATPISFNTRCNDGQAEGPKTFVRFLWSDLKLFFHVEVEKTSFACKNVNSQLWNGSNVEFLISPKWLAKPCKDEYEFLFNSQGGFTPLHWEGKGLDHALEWQANDLKWQIVNEPSFANNTWCFVAEVPFSTFNLTTPAPGSYWGLGLFRKITPETGDDLLQAWSPTLENPPRFHRPKSFGMLVFKR